MARLEAELANAEVELERRRKLHQDEVLSATELDAFELVAEQRRALLDAGRDLLDAVAEIRPVDVELARAELDEAITASERVRADYELTLVRTPIAGEVLEVNARPGEVVGPNGIVELGDLSRMIVVAEVYATDVACCPSRRAGRDHRRVPDRAAPRQSGEDRTRDPAQRDPRSRPVGVRRPARGRGRDRGRRRRSAGGAGARRSSRAHRFARRSAVSRRRSALGAPLAWLQLAGEPMRLVAAVAGIAFAVLLMLMQIGIREALFRSATRLHERLRADLVMTSSHYQYQGEAAAFAERRLDPGARRS